MSRPHIEFLQAQAVTWRNAPNRPGADQKTLSEDQDAGAQTAIVRYPAGWSANEDVYSGVEEGFVLSGEMTCGERRLGEGSYYFLPSGFDRSSLRSDGGADVLTFFDPDSTVSQSEAIFSDTESMDWSGNVDPNVAAGSFGKKVLREDPETGERVWILMLGPASREAVQDVKTEIHPFVEEAFVLEGEISMPMGTMSQGAYLWRPGGIEHGPFASLPGMTAFFRSVGGPMTTQWSEGTKRVRFDAPYDPILPDSLKPAVQQKIEVKQPY